MQYDVHDMAKKAKKRLRGKEGASPRVTTEMVRAMLEGGIVINPLGRLTDHAVFDTLDDAGRQRYILELAKSYNSCLKKLKKRA